MARAAAVRAILSTGSYILPTVGGILSAAGGILCTGDAILRTVGVILPAFGPILPGSEGKFCRVRIWIGRGLDVFRNYSTLRGSIGKHF